MKNMDGYRMNRNTNMDTNLVADGTMNRIRNQLPARRRETGPIERYLLKLSPPAIE